MVSLTISARVLPVAATAVLVVINQAVTTIPLTTIMVAPLVVILAGEAVMVEVLGVIGKPLETSLPVPTVVLNVKFYV